MIYFAQPTDGGPVKIGYSADVPARLRQLESHYGRPLALLATLPGDFEEEQAIHARFAHLRLNGKGRRGVRPEQFRPAPDLMAFIGRPLFVNQGDVELIAGPKPDSGAMAARLELPSDDMERIRRAARSIGLSLSAFIRQAVLEKAVDVERRMNR